MSKIFVDCGYYVGKAVEIYRDKGIVDKTWRVYAFEPAPNLNPAVHIERIGIPTELIKKACWIEDSEVIFQVSNRENASSIEGTTGNSGAKIVKVPCIDFSAFIGKLPQVDICSMDIEGAEFEVLEKMLREDTIDKIKLLDIEFHHRFMNDYTDKDAERYIKQIKKRGVKVKLKIPLR